MDDKNINILINKFLLNPKMVENNNIEIIKKHYYTWCKPLLKLNNINELKIGSNSNKKLLFFKKAGIEDNHLVLRLNFDNIYMFDNYFFYKKNFKNIISETNKEVNQLNIITKTKNTSKDYLINNKSGFKKINFCNICNICNIC